MAAARAVLLAAALLWPAGPLHAQSAGSGFKFDSSRPIEISADSLEVSQDEKSALFQGNVRAEQGDMLLRADTLTVYYREEGEKTNDEQSPFTRIDAKGHITISSPSETGSGDWAVYDVDRKIITVGGAVQLVRGNNVINGKRLVLDLASGRSKIEGDGGPGQKGRVRAVLQPKKKSGQ